MAHRTISVLLALGVIAGAAACSSSSRPAHVSSSSQTASSAPPSSASSSPDFTSTPATPVPSSTAATTSGCPATADKCDDFSSTSTGWPVTNTANYYANYDNYLGGTYRIGERHDATISEDAPIKATDVSNNYSVQIDADVIAGTGAPATAAAGFVCWEQENSDGDGTTGFVLSINGSTADIGLWDSFDSTYHKIASEPAAGLLNYGGTPNHLTALCIQGTHAGGPQAQIGLAVNGKVAVTAAYDKTVKNYEWSVANGIGVIAEGNGADFFYDNFALTSKCTGDFC
jgi:hypothetical protein